MTERTQNSAGSILGSAASVSLKRVVIIAGALVGMLIGSGFATGQEIMQYFVSYGTFGILGAVVVMALLAFVAIGFISAGNAMKFRQGSEVFSYFCGSKLGKFYDYFSIAFVYMTYIIMISGAASTASQQYGLPAWAGGFGMMILVIGTVLLGLDHFVNLIGTIMPMVILACFYLAFHTLFQSAGNIPESIAVIPDLVASGELMQASDSWFMAALSYVGFSILLLAAFLAETGKGAGSSKEATGGALLGAVALCTAILILTVALMSRAGDIAGSPIPALMLANQIHPLFGNFYSLIMFVGIFSTAVPLLWNPSARFAKEGTRKFRLLVLVLGTVGGLIGLFIEFPRLINIIYVLNGYVGILLLAVMLIHFVRHRGFLTAAAKKQS